MSIKKSPVIVALDGTEKGTVDPQVFLFGEDITLQRDINSLLQFNQAQILALLPLVTPSGAFILKYS